MAAGVYIAYKKDGTQYFRASLTYHNKHISLGSFQSQADAAHVYQESLSILSDSDTYQINPETGLTTYNLCQSGISHNKFICLLNFRDNHMYFKTPIYICKSYFLYYISEHNMLKFDADDLFYYASHSISTRGGYYYITDYGMQISILSRYGIRNHSVAGRDYIFKNGDSLDYRYQNIQVINPYHGVRKVIKNGRSLYVTKIHINGDYIAGYYNTETDAAIAYNKAVDQLTDILPINYPRNYISSLSSIEYAAIYNRITFQKNFREYINTSISINQ